MTADLAAAETHARRALEVANATSNRAVVSWVKIKASHLAVRRGDIDAARSVLGDGLRIALAIGAPSLKFDAVNCFAEILQAQGEASCARRVLAYAADHPAAARLYQELREAARQAACRCGRRLELAGTGTRGSASPHRRREQPGARAADRHVARRTSSLSHQI